LVSLNNEKDDKINNAYDINQEFLALIKGAAEGKAIPLESLIDLSLRYENVFDPKSDKSNDNIDVDENK